MPEKATRKEFYIAMKKKDFKKLEDFLNDDVPVYLTFLSATNYKNNKQDNAVMVKTAFEKA